MRVNSSYGEWRSAGLLAGLEATKYWWLREFPLVVVGIRRSLWKGEFRLLPKVADCFLAKLLSGCIAPVTLLFSLALLVLSHIVPCLFLLANCLKWRSFYWRKQIFAAPKIQFYIMPNAYPV